MSCGQVQELEPGPRLQRVDLALRIARLEQRWGGSDVEAGA